MKSSEYHELIERYLNEQMPVSEKAAFEERLQQDAELHKLVFHHRKLKQAIGNKGKIDFIRKLDQAGNTYFKKKGLIALSPTFKYAAAAAILILIGFGIYLLQNGHTPSNKKLFDKYFESYISIIENRDADDRAPLLTEGMLAYKNRNYKKSIQSFDKLIAHPAYGLPAAFYTGLCYLELNQAEMAITYLKMATSPDSIFKQEAEWYLSLAYLLGDHKQQSTELLESIAEDPDHYYHNQALKLLKQIR